MNRSTALSAAGLALVLATGCTRDTDFDLKKTFHVQAVAPALTFSATQSADLATEAGLAWSYRDKVKSVKVGLATASARNVVPSAGTTGSGSASFVPSGGGAPVAIGSFTDVPIVDGQLISVVGSDALNQALTDALKGDGKLSVQLDGNASQSFQADIDVTLHVTVEYTTNPF